MGEGKTFCVNPDYIWISCIVLAFIFKRCVMNNTFPNKLNH